MSDNQERLLRQYCAHVLLKYGFEFTTHDPIIPSLFIIHEELMANKVGNEEVARTIQAALRKLNPTVYNFSGHGEAWKFKFAESLRWLFAGICLLIAISVGLIWWRQNNDVSRARQIIASYSGIYHLLTRRAEKNEHGFIYLDFSRARGKYVENYVEYEELGTDTVRVYLGKVN